MASPGKVREISLAVQDFILLDTATAAHLQSVMGLLVSCRAVVPLCLFRLRSLSSHLDRNFKWKSDLKCPSRFT